MSDAPRPLEVPDDFTLPDGTRFIRPASIGDGVYAELFTINPTHPGRVEMEFHAPIKSAEAIASKGRRKGNPTHESVARVWMTDQAFTMLIRAIRHMTKDAG